MLDVIRTDAHYDIVSLWVVMIALSVIYVHSFNFKIKKLCHAFIDQSHFPDHEPHKFQREVFWIINKEDVTWSGHVDQTQNSYTRRTQHGFS